MVWDKPEILRAIKKLDKQKKDLSYNAMTRRMQPLVSAAAYHFGSYRAAVERAGIDYATVIRRPRWTRPLIIGLIKNAKRRGEDLHWSAVTRRLDADEVNRYRKWNKNSIVFELRGRAKEHEPLNSGAVQRDDPGLHAAAVRHFSSYDAALRAARLDPQSVRARRSWNDQEVIRGLKAAKRSGGHLSDSAVRREDPALYGAAVRLFGSFTAAREAAGINLKR